MLRKIAQKIALIFWNSDLAPLVLKFYELFEPKKERTIELLDCKMKIDPQKVGERAFIFGNHSEPKIFPIAMSKLEDGDNFVDVGAWRGDYSLPAAPIVGNEGKVIAFEPDEDNLNRFKQNLKINYFKNVEIIDKAVSNFVGKTSFNSGGNLTSKISNQGKREIETTTLNKSLSSISKIKLLKIDVEGHEKEVLEGANNILNKVKNLIVEVHKSKGVNLLEIQKIIEDQNFKTKKIRRSKKENVIWLIGEK